MTNRNISAPAGAAEERQARAKRPRTALAGPYGHPLHATVVTVPIGAWTASVVFDILALCGVEPRAFSLGAQWLVAIGVIAALGAAVLGLLDLSQLEKGTKARRTALIHLGFNSAAIVLFAIGFVVRTTQVGQASVAGFVVSLVALACVGVSGFLGGELAYRYGVRVADEATQRKGFE
ncbi:DUF2231 domain-containing protein [Leifsonia sp. NPDC058292]|uniref:DUF2231 domain-containing protein n=1 Tax=Leifsonia sp. NPDC058292 TaxID=3346428 RepID=UPI0036DA943C